MKGHLFKGYDALLPPFPLRYDDWSEKEAEEYLAWYTAHIPERVDYLAGQVGIHLAGEKIPPETLLDVWTWFYREAQVETVPQEEVRRQREAFGYLGESFIQKTRFTLRTEFILRDIAMYTSAVFTSNYPVLCWDIVRKPKRDVCYHRPVIKGFLNLRYGKPFASTFQPDLMLNTQAAKFRNRTGSVNDLLAIYRLWTQDIPQSEEAGPSSD